MTSGRTRRGISRTHPPTLCPKTMEGAVLPADCAGGKTGRTPCQHPRPPDILLRRATCARRRARGPGAPWPTPRPEEGPLRSEQLEAPKDTCGLWREGGPGFWEHQAQDGPGYGDRASALTLETHREGRLCHVRGKKPGNRLLRAQALWTESAAASWEVSLDALHNVHPRGTGMGATGQQA